MRTKFILPVVATAIAVSLASLQSIAQTPATPKQIEKVNKKPGEIMIPMKNGFCQTA